MIVATVTTDLYAVQGLMSMVAAPRAGMSFLTLDMGVEQFSEASCVSPDPVPLVPQHVAAPGAHHRPGGDHPVPGRQGVHLSISQ